MGHSISSIGNLLLGEKEIRILMGLDAAGKTTTLYKLKLGRVVQTISTIGYNKEVIKHGKVHFTIWDVPARTKGTPFWRLYYQKGTGLVFVVDSSDRERITEAEHELTSLLSCHELSNAVLLVLANKQDLPNAMTPYELTQKLQLHKWNNLNKWSLQPTSAIQGEGLFDALEWLASELV